MDSSFLGGFPLHTDSPPEYDGQWLLDLDGEIGRYFVNRHDQGINILFVDFSVRKVGLKQLYEFKWHRFFRTDLGPRDDVACGSAGGWPEWMCKFRRFD
jgi:prepilin-type processing-associated H-X9-DG protein